VKLRDGAKVTDTQTHTHSSSSSSSSIDNLKRNIHKNLTGLRNQFNVVASQHNLIFDVVGAHELDARCHCHTTNLHIRCEPSTRRLPCRGGCYLLLTKKVSDFNARTAVGDSNVVRKVCVHKSHLVFKTLLRKRARRRVSHTSKRRSRSNLGDAGHHIANVRRDGSHHRTRFTIAKVHLDEHRVVLDEHVERLRDFATNHKTIVCRRRQNAPGA
jgi:hypothetical protein